MKPAQSATGKAILMEGKRNIDRLLEIVSKGGSVRTGIDIYNNSGVLLLEKNVLINEVNPLLVIKNSGIEFLSIDSQQDGGLWDKDGNQIFADCAQAPAPGEKPDGSALVERKIREIGQLRKETAVRYQKAKENIKKVIKDIEDTGGQFDYDSVESTVTDLFQFLTAHESAFSYLTKEIFSYDDYLYNHSINVCTIATAILKKFNEHFSELIDSHLVNLSKHSFPAAAGKPGEAFIYYGQEELKDIAIGYFLHDMGKVLVPDEILNKQGKLTDTEFNIIRDHAFINGKKIIEKNGISNPFIRNPVLYHHAALYSGEANCYPQIPSPAAIAPYVKICKLSDVYDAMTSKRAYKEALNPISVVTDIFRKFAGKDRLLQIILHSFVRAVGIYPPGSIVYMRNGQMVYIIDGEGPLVIPVTDAKGAPLTSRADPIDLAEEEKKGSELRIDRREPLVSPADAYALLPDYLKETVRAETAQPHRLDRPKK
jgi:HD-GYP domain-containing protein (c-di-GMP phosphodiesterase class II)